MARTYKYSIITRMGMAEGGIKSKTIYAHPSIHPPEHLIVQNREQEQKTTAKFADATNQKTYIQFAIGVNVEFHLYAAPSNASSFDRPNRKIVASYVWHPPLVAYRPGQAQPSMYCRVTTAACSHCMGACLMPTYWRVTHSNFVRQTHRSTLNKKKTSNKRNGALIRYTSTKPYTLHGTPRCESQPFSAWKLVCKHRWCVQCTPPFVIASPTRNTLLNPFNSKYFQYFRWYSFCTSCACVRRGAIQFQRLNGKL